MNECNLIKTHTKNQLMAPGCSYPNPEYRSCTNLSKIQQFPDPLSFVPQFLWDIPKVDKLPQSPILIRLDRRNKLWSTLSVKGSESGVFHLESTYFTHGFLHGKSCIGPSSSYGASIRCTHFWGWKWRNFIHRACFELRWSETLCCFFLSSEFSYIYAVRESILEKTIKKIS